LNNLFPRKTLSKLKQYMKAMSGKGQNRIQENDRKTYAFPGSKRHHVVETTNSSSEVMT